MEFQILGPLDVRSDAAPVALGAAKQRTLLAILFIGLVLDVQGAGSPEDYSLDAFKWAFAVQVPLWILGLTMIFVETRRTKRWMAEHGRRLR